MGPTDKTIRILAALVISGLYYFNVITGTLAYILMAVAIVFLLTSLVNFCPLYRVFGLTSLKKK